MLPRTIWSPGRRPRAARPGPPLVASGMKAGVSTGPCGVWRMPARASPSRASIANSPATPGYGPHHGCGISERPVIAAGCGIPSSSSIVGATSARMPPSRSLAPCDGDEERHRVERVGGVRLAVGLEHLLAVAVIGGDEAGAARSRRPRRRLGRGSASTASTAWIAAGSTPVWPTMSGLAKLTRMKSYLPLAIARRRPRRRRRRRSSRASGRRWRRRAARGRACGPRPRRAPRGRR